MKHLRTVAALLALTAPPALADDVAVIIANERYQALLSARGASAVTRSTQTLGRLGYRVASQQDATRDAIARVIDSALAQPDQTERLIVVLSGQFATVGGETFLLPTDLRNSGSAGSIVTGALPLSPILGFLAEHPGEAALFLATADARLREAPGIAAGVGPIDAPQGVLVAVGSPSDVANALEGSFLKPGMTVARAAAQSPQLEYRGLLSPTLRLAGSRSDDGPATEKAPDLEDAFWQVAVELDTREGYRTYLERYPNGRHAASARARIEAIEARAPDVSAEEEAEKALKLSANDRRDVQRWLDLLGYDPRGIDGIFGPGTRAALTRWQAQNGLPATGYLDVQSLRKLRNQGERRAAELKAEAERRKAEEDARDTAFWKETGASGTEAGLRAYLARYPDGLFAETARAQLARIEAVNRQKARAEERTDWDAARAEDTQRAYNDFLRKWPSGVFAEEAKARLAEIDSERAGRNEREEARAEEESLRLPGATRLLAEGKLAALGFNPGTIDGRITEETRRAIRRYQRSRGIEPTGYLTRETTVRLLSE